MKSDGLGGESGYTNGISKRGLSEKSSYINGTSKSGGVKPKKKKRGKSAVVIVILTILLISSMVVLIHQPVNRAHNGFVLGVEVPYEKSYNPSLVDTHEFLGNANVTQKIGIVIGFKWKNSDELNYFLQGVNNPKSSNYRHFLTWEQFKEKYAPSAQIYNATLDWLEGMNDAHIKLHIEHTWQLRNAISIVDTVGNIEKVFHTKIGLFEGDGIHTRKQFYAAMKPLELPGNIIPYLNGISGTDNSRVYHLNFHTSSSTGVRWVYASDLQKMYHVIQLYNNSATAASTTHPILANGLRVATVLWEGYYYYLGLIKEEAAPFDPANIYHYWDHVIPTWEQDAGGISHVWGYGTESDCVAPGTDNDQSGTNLENELDLEMIGTLAPGVDVVCVYSDSSQTNFPADNYNYILNTLAKNSTLVAVSNSWGGGDSSVDSITMADVQALNALGVTVLASSGDDGDTTSPSEPSTAAYDNYGFIAVGGTSPIPNGVDDTNTNLDTDTYQTMGNNTYISNPRSDEIVWYDASSTQSNGDHWGTQSGVSSTYSEPSWQSTYIGSYSGRVTADVSAVGNRTIIYATYYDSNTGSFNTSWIGMAGTSVACPVVAGELTSMAAYSGRYYDGQGTVTGDTSIYGFGFLAPTLYKVGYDYYNNGMYSSSPPFFDVVNGSTGGGGSAGVGWDQVTGWGVINAWEFIHDIGPYMSSVQSSQTVNAGESTYYNIKIWFPYDWTSEMGHFQIEGLPSGVTYTTNVTYVHPSGNGAVAWVNFTLTTTSSTQAGTYTLTILAYTYNHTSNNWGNLSASTQVTLVVNQAVPEFSDILMLPLLIFLVGAIAVWRRERGK